MPSIFRTPRPALDSRRRRLAVAAAMSVAVATAAGLSGCAGLVTPSTLSFSETDLTLMLARQFPQERRVLEVIDVQLANPQLALQPERNRLSTALDVDADDRLFGGHAHAHLRLDYGLRYEPSDHSLRLKDVRLQEMAMDAGASTLHGQARRLGALATEHLLENLSIYRMKPDQAERFDALGIEPKSITVTARGVEIALGPKAAR